jgi:probable addiction module antidote protein
MKAIKVKPAALKKLGVKRFDVADYLDDDAMIAEYLTQVLADEDSDEFIRAVGHVAKARGMAQIAKEAGLGRESLYKALTPGAKPRFDTMIKVIHALGIQLRASTN